MTLTLDYVMSKSAARLTGLLPVVRTATERLIQRSFAIGIPIVITQGLRTIAEQDALYAQGRSKPGKVVTNARGGYSYHNFGVAVDYVLLMPDGKSVSWDTVRDGNGDKRSDWLQVAEIGKGLGFTWGGDWASFPDYPHLQMDFGLSTVQYRSGQRPTQAKINAVMAKLQNKEDKPMTSEEKKQMEELKATVESQAKWIAAQKAKENMECPKWAEEAYEYYEECITDNKGSYDFWRQIVIMYRNENNIRK